jgi:hypothetical protein
MDKVFPAGWNLQKTVVWGLVLAVVLNLGSDLYLKFLSPIIRGALN